MIDYLLLIWILVGIFFLGFYHGYKVRECMNKEHEYGTNK